MDLILAADLKNGQIVHGKSGMRDEYRPIVTPLAATSDPAGYLSGIQPRYLYVADLDRISGCGGHDHLIPTLADRVELLMLDRGCRSPDDLIVYPRVINVIGTETAGPDLSRYSGGYLSVDMKDGRVLPDMSDPLPLLARAGESAFEGCILLDISGVGTQRGMAPSRLASLRSAYPGRLLWGGGVSSVRDLFLLDEHGYDGAIIATAVHTGKVPLEMIRRGHLC
jgi:phosphoribosylformimino-5-aminoimidazole carboxamide ribotide isomerase